MDNYRATMEINGIAHMTVFRGLGACRCVRHREYYLHNSSQYVYKYYSIS